MAQGTGWGRGGTTCEGFATELTKLQTVNKEVNKLKGEKCKNAAHNPLPFNHNLSLQMDEKENTDCKAAYQSECTFESLIRSELYDEYTHDLQAVLVVFF